MLPVLIVVLLVLLPAAPASADTGPWGWPLAGPHEVARPFAPPASRYGSGHRGADLPGAPGAVVQASAAGRVTYAGLLAGRGVVVVTHGALRTTYEPVTASVRVGQVVALGEPVGRLAAGHLGCPAEACLHWGLRRGEEYLDPVRLVERGPLRLLPMEDRTTGGPAGAQSGVRHALPRDRSGTRGPIVSAPAPPLPPPVDEPPWSVRAAEAPLGAAAVVALVLGVGLLARPRPLPPSPSSGGLSAPAAPPPDESPGSPGLLLDLGEARARRHAAS